MLGFSPLADAALADAGGQQALSFNSATTDGADVGAASVSVLVSASSATTDGADTSAATVSVLVAASSSTTDGADTASASVSPLVTASSATTDGADTLTASVSPIITASVAKTDGPDALSATVMVPNWTLNSTQAALLLSLHRLHGLSMSEPLSVSTTARSAGGLSQSVTVGAGSTTVSTTANDNANTFNAGLLVEELAALHGITATLTVTDTSRTAGSITQTIGTVGATTTVTRV